MQKAYAQERRIEEASLNSWPAFQQMLFDGWVVRSTKGYTKRANSVTPLYPSFLPDQDKVVACENFYQKQQQPTIFRLLSFSPASHELDHVLAQRGYQRVDHVLILGFNRDQMQAKHLYDTLSLETLSLTVWLSLFSQFRQLPDEQHDIHSEMLKRLVPDPLFAVLHNKDGLPVACGLGVLENAIFGLFDITTAPEERNKGYGTQLLIAMLDWARQHGASQAYLQVANTNQVACHIYTKLGFHELYHYWYRIR